MANDVIINAATLAALQNFQSLQGAAQQSLKHAAQNEKAVADLVEQTTDDLGATTPTHGNVVNIKT